MKLGQTGRFYAATVFMFLILSSVLAIALPTEGELADMYSILYAQSSLLLALLISVGLMAFSRKKHGLKPLYMPYSGKNSGRHDIFGYLLMPVLSFVMIYGFNDINEVVLYLFSRLGINGSGISVFWTTPGYFVVALVLIALTPALVEETFIRGYCLEGLSGLKNYAAILISALLFSVMHMNPSQTVYQFLLGVVMALLVKISGKITYSMLLHFCNNAFVVVTTYFTDSFENPTVDLSFSLWAVGYAVAGVIGLATVLCLFAYIFKRKEKNQLSTFRWLKTMLVSYGTEDVTAATKAEKMVFWVFFAVIALVWILNTVTMSMGV